VQLHFGRPVAPAAGSTERRLHVYLYQVAPHAALRNADLPTRAADGRLAGRPQAALELHYMIAFYGDEAKLEPDRMLGAVARDLHAIPVLGAQDIADTITGQAVLHDSDLAAAPERVKFTPATLTLDDQSRLWSVLIQTPHTLSVFYTASVVLLDALEGGTRALPVLRRGANDQGPEANVGSLPGLDEAWAGFAASVERRPPLPSLRAAPLGATLIITGRNLGADTVTLEFRHPLLPAQAIDVPAAQRDASTLRLALPDDAAAHSAWTAGLYGVTAHVRRGAVALQSPLLPLLVAPAVTAIAPNPAPRVGSAVTLHVGCRPQVLPEQLATLLFAGHEVAADPHPAATDTLVFVIDPAPAVAGQPVRLRIDGVDSLPLRLDPASGNFVFDDAQRVTIT
jgi:hypothetical protein